MITEKGVVLHPGELTGHWEETILGSDISLVGFHPVGGDGSHLRVAELAANGLAPGEAKRVDRLKAAGTGIEYELHAMSLLLPRGHFAAHPEWFRLDEAGNRNADYNCCATNPDALEMISRSSEKLARSLAPTTHRYNLWLDDVRDKSCHCPDCEKLSVSDQAMLVYNAVLRGLRRADPLAMQSYLGYCGTSEPPKVITPDDGIFLEFAPFDRDFHLPLTDGRNSRSADDAKKLIAFFGKENAKALDYWLDNSLYSGWTKPPKRFTLDRDCAERDLGFYDSLGFGTVTTFACYLGGDYEELYGFPDLNGYIH